MSMFYFNRKSRKVKQFSVSLNTKADKNPITYKPWCVVITFSFGADGKEPFFCRDSEPWSDPECVAAQVHLPVGGIHEAEEENAIEMFGCELYTSLSIQMDDWLPITSCVVIETESFTNLSKGRNT